MSARATKSAVAAIVTVALVGVPAVAIAQATHGGTDDDGTVAEDEFPVPLSSLEDPSLGGLVGPPITIEDDEPEVARLTLYILED